MGFTFMRESSSSVQMAPLLDSFGRVAKKLRISATDRCNFRCTFCMPVHPSWLPKEQILSFEEIARLARVFASMGIDTIRLSGGEPLMRQDVERLVQLLVNVPGIKKVSMTTNGFQLAEKAAALKRAGLASVTVSLHSLKQDRFTAIQGSSAFDQVLLGIKTAQEIGLHPVKINTVVMKACNEDEVVDFARLAHDSNLSVRFIEYMPFDGQHVWDMDRVYTGEQVINEIQKVYPLVRLPREAGATAKVFRFEDGRGEIGLITSMSNPFCSDCDRVRLKADGKIVPCLFSQKEYDIMRLMRNGGTDEDLAAFIRNSFWQKDPGVETQLKNHLELTHIRPMHTIGG